MTKFAIFLALSSIVFLSGCRIQKNISKQENQKEEVSKVDSAATVKNDIQKETKAVTETTEIIDSTAFITPDGKLINDPKDVTKESIKVPIKKKKTTKRTEEIKETDKSQSKVDVKKQSDEKTETKATIKDVQKSGLLPGWAWWLIALLILIALAWRFRKFFVW